MIRKIFVGAAFATILGCGGTTGSVENRDNPKTDLEPFYCDEIAEIGDVEQDEDEEFSRTEILSYELINQCLCIKYQYSGCVEGERMLVWDAETEFPPDTRPEVMMELLVRDAGMCEQLLTDSACFSMKEMQLVGNQVLVFLNDEQQNILLNFDSLPEEDQ